MSPVSRGTGTMPAADSWSTKNLAKTTHSFKEWQLAG